MLAQVEALKGQHRTLDIAVTELRGMQRQLDEICLHDAHKYECAPYTWTWLRSGCSCGEEDRGGPSLVSAS